jgi:hypothetical protein
LQCRLHIFSAHSQAAVTERFNRWGGIPRWVLENTDDEDQMLITDALAECSIGELVSSINNLSTARKASHRLLHMTVRPNYMKGPVRFASEWVEDQALSMYLQSQQQAVHDFMVASGGESTIAEFRGKLWERHAHRKLQQGGQWTCRSLTSDSDEYEITLPPCTSVLGIWDHTDIAQLADAVYAWGKNKRFPAVDAVMQPDKMFQITVSDSHGIDVKGLNNASRALRAFPNVKLYFVVPPDIFTQFKKQSLKRIRGDVDAAQAARDIEQCVIRIDFS